jgi:hypothetical protein
MIDPDPTKARCKKCNSKIKLREGGLDSDFYACNCKLHGSYKIVIYYGWDLPPEWELPFLYWVRWKLAKFILSK